MPNATMTKFVMELLTETVKSLFAAVRGTPRTALPWMGAVVLGVWVPFGGGWADGVAGLEQWVPFGVSQRLAQLVTQQVDTVAIMEQVGPSVVAVTVPLPHLGADRNVQGSGVIVGRQGNTYAVLTNWHVVESRLEGATVKTEDGTTHSVTERRRLAGLDAAVIYFESGRAYPVAPLGDAMALRTGELLFAIGYPNGEYNLGSRDRTIDSFMFTQRRTGENVPQGYRLAYTDGVPTPGMSGSPLVNTKGQVVGLYGLAEKMDTDRLYGVPLDLIVPAARQVGLELGGSRVATGPTLPTGSPSPPVAPPVPQPVSLPQQRTHLGIPVERLSYTSARVSRTGEVTTYQAETPVGVYTERLNLPNGAVPLTMVEIPGGTFTMGSPDSEANRVSGEGPQHEVTLPDFFMGQYEITQAQWFAVMGRDYNAKNWQESWNSLDSGQFKGDNRPIVQVSWEDAAEFCRRLSQLTGRNYRLATEAEWEYAARAGTKTPFAYGETIVPSVVNYDGNYPYGDAPIGEYRNQTIAVNDLYPNPWGLFHVHGNVWEWVQDEYRESYNNKPEELKRDGSRPWLIDTNVLDDDRMVLRGGSWDNVARYSRSANRVRYRRGYRSIGNGFRVVLE